MSLQRKTPLKSKTTFKAKAGLKRNLKPQPKKRKRLKLQEKSASQLIKDADKAFSRYVRIRDSELVGDVWVGPCITCPRKLTVWQDGKFVRNAQNGHLISRGVHSLRFEEENCNLQCSHCNAWLDKDEMIERYRAAVDEKYGQGTYKRLKALSKLPEAHKRLRKPELLQIIKDSNEQVDFYLKQIGNYAEEKDR